MPRTRSAYKAELVRRSLIFQNQPQLPENATNQHSTNDVSSDSNFVVPVLAPAQFSKTAELCGNVTFVKPKEVSKAVQNVASAVNQSRSTCDELLQVLPLGLRFDQGSRDQIFSTLAGLEEYLENVDISRTTNNQYIPNPDDHATANSFSYQYSGQSSIDEFDPSGPTQSTSENHNVLAEKNRTSIFIFENSLLCNNNDIPQTNCPETVKSGQGSVNIRNDPNKGQKDDKTGRKNKDSTSAASKSVQHLGRRYNTRSADGTRKPKIMFDGFVTELPKKRKLINIVELKKMKRGKWIQSNKVIPEKTKDFDPTLPKTGEGDVPAVSAEETKLPLKLPTIPKGSFGYFFEDFYKEYKIKSPDHPLNQVMKYAGVKWRGMSEDDKKKYRDRQNAARIRYRSEMKIFNAQHLKSKHSPIHSYSNNLEKKSAKVKDKLPPKSSNAKGKLPESLSRVAEKLAKTFVSETSAIRQRDHSSSNNQLPYGVPGPSTLNKNASNDHMSCAEPGLNALSNLCSQTNGTSSSDKAIVETEARGETSLPTVSAIESIFKRTSKGNESTQSSFYMYPGRKMISQIKNAKKCDSSEQILENNEGVVHKRKRAIH